MNIKHQPSNPLSSPTLSEGDLGGGRIYSLDLARGFTVLLMPAIHVCMMYSKPEVQTSLLGRSFAFIAEGPGAQLFMMIMGISFVYSSRITAKYVLHRALAFIIAAYSLNILKFILPLEADGIPENLLNELHLDDDLAAIKFFFLMGDILHFAAIAYLVLYAVSKLKHYPYIAIALAILITFLSPYLWDLKTGITTLDYCISLFNGHPPYIFFPVFPWLVYPLIGLAIGYYLKRTEIKRAFKNLTLLGITLLIISISLLSTPPNKDWLSFYRTAPADTIFHIAIVLCWLALIQWLSKKFKPNFFFSLLEFSSKNITLIYILQWILICWCLAITGYMQLNFFSTICWMAAITTFTLLLTLLINKWYAKPKSL